MTLLVLSDMTISVENSYDDIKRAIDAAHEGIDNKILSNPVFIEVRARRQAFRGATPLIVNILDIKRVEFE